MPEIEPTTPLQARVLRLLAAGLILLVVAVAVYALVGNRLIDAAYKHETGTFLDRLVPQPPRHPVEHYHTKGRILVTRGVLLAVLAGLAVLATTFRRRVAAFLRDFFLAEGAALNLAVFRIAFFATLLLMLRQDAGVFLLYSGMPDELRFAPFGLGAVARVVPFDPDATLVLLWVLRAVCVAGLIGLFSRTAAWLAFGLGVYLLGVPQFFGFVYHYHHLIWFAALLGASRCGDALSLDAWLAGRPRLAPAVAYGAPLRVVWVLIGLVYFFPGFWKLYESGLDWALSDNLRYTLYEKWSQLDGWQPFFRLDQYPLLYKAAGLATLAFEIGFIFASFFPATRWLVVVMALGFHNGTNLTMQISFWHLQLLYVAFIDWQWLLDRLGGKPAPVAGGPTPAAWPALAVGGFLIGVNVLLGVGGVEKAWPFSCYPTFCYLVTADNETLELRVHGTKENLPQKAIREQLRSERWSSLLPTLAHLRDPSVRDAKMRALWQFLEGRGLVPSGVARVDVVRVPVVFGPDGARPIAEREEVLFTFATGPYEQVTAPRPGRDR